jgi:hypothetical protein
MPHMFDRLFAILDSRLLSRIGNLETLTGVLAGGGLLLIAIVVATVDLFVHTGWVPLEFLGLTLVVVLLFGVSRLQRHLRQRRAKSDPRVPEITANLKAVADRLEGFIDARNVAEPEPPIDPGVYLEEELYEMLVDYEKKTMALYYESHRADALNAFDACDVLGYTRGRERERSIIYKPDGTAALALVPGILRDMGWKLIGI